MAISTQSVANSAVTPNSVRVLANARPAALSYADALLTALTQIDVSGLVMSPLTVTEPAAGVGNSAVDAQATPDVYTAPAASSPTTNAPTSSAAMVATPAATDLAVAPPAVSASAAGYFDANGSLQGLLVEAASQAVSTVATDPTYAAAAAAHYASAGAMHFPSNDSQIPCPGSAAHSSRRSCQPGTARTWRLLSSVGLIDLPAIAAALLLRFSTRSLGPPGGDTVRRSPYPDSVPSNWRSPRFRFPRRR